MQRIVQGLLIFGLSCLAIALISFPVHAVEIKNVPNPRNSNVWVTDMSNILSPQTEMQLNQMIAELEQKNGTEIAIVTVPNTAPYGTPKEFTTMLFNYWHIGKKGANNGVIFVVSKGDRRVEIETGYGVEGVLPDAQVGNIIEQKITPQFKQGNFDQGVLDGTKALVAVISGEEFSSEISTQSNHSWLFWLGGGGLITGGLYKFLNRRRYVEPIGKTNCTLLSRPVYCKKCRKPMEQVLDELVNRQLTDIEMFSQDKNYTKFVGWQCLTCRGDEEFNFHILFNVLRGDCEQCPRCEGWTMLRTDVVKIPPTYTSTGVRVISKNCDYCHHQESETRILLVRQAASSSNSSGGSGGGDFGGGDSGGGGAGGDW